MKPFITLSVILSSAYASTLTPTYLVKRYQNSSSSSSSDESWLSSITTSTGEAPTMPSSESGLSSVSNVLSSNINHIVSSSGTNFAKETNAVTSTFTTVVTSFTTVCPAPTTFTINDKPYTASSSGETITITDCPCTLMKVAHSSASAGVETSFRRPSSSITMIDSDISNEVKTSGPGPQSAHRIITTASVVSKLTTACRTDTTVTTNGKTYTATSGQTLTITDCPCTLKATYTVSPTLSSTARSKSSSGEATTEQENADTMSNTPTTVSRSEVTILNTESSTALPDVDAHISDVTVSQFTTYCETGTTLTTNGRTYTATSGEFLIITGCPCALKSTVRTALEPATSHSSRTTTTLSGDKGTLDIISPSLTPTGVKTNKLIFSPTTVSATLVTNVVTALITVCSEQTTFSTNGKTFTATRGETITITDCPCTVTSDLHGTTAAATEKTESATDAHVVRSTTMEPTSVTWTTGTGAFVTSGTVVDKTAESSQTISMESKGSQNSESPKSTESSKSTEPPKGPVPTKSPKGTESTESPMGSETTESPMGSETTESSQSNEPPKSAEVTEFPKVPKTSESPKSTESPKVTVTTESPKEPETTELPKAPEIKTTGSETSQRTKGVSDSTAVKSNPEPTLVRGSSTVSQSSIDTLTFVESSSVSAVTYTTLQFVSTLTTSCSLDTIITTNGGTYTATAGQTLTITDCPCALTQTHTVAPSIASVPSQLTSSTVLNTVSSSTIETVNPKDGIGGSKQSNSGSAKMSSASPVVASHSTASSNGPSLVAVTASGPSTPVLANGAVIKSPYVITTTIAMVVLGLLA